VTRLNEFYLVARRLNMNSKSLIIAAVSLCALIGLPYLILENKEEVHLSPREIASKQFQKSYSFKTGLSAPLKKKTVSKIRRKPASHLAVDEDYTYKDEPMAGYQEATTKISKKAKKKGTKTSLSQRDDNYQLYKHHRSFQDEDSIDVSKKSSTSATNDVRGVITNSDNEVAQQKPSSSETTDQKTYTQGSTAVNFLAEEKITGKVPPLIGKITASSQALPFLREIYAANCVNPKIQVFDILTMTVLATNPLNEETLSQSTEFEFDPKAIGIDLDTPTRYILKTEGCDLTYERIITSFFTNQDLTPSSTLVSKIIKSSVTLSITEVDGSDLEKVIDTLQTNMTNDSTVEDAYKELSKSESSKNIFTNAFKGAVPEVLEETAPDLEAVTIPSSLSEEVAANFIALATHWDSSYTLAYQWVLDGVDISNSSTWTYTPTANSKSSYNVTLYIGKKNNSDANVDRTIPHHEFNYTISVVNTLAAQAPSISLNAGSTNPTNNRNISIDLNTGAALNNCKTFSSMAITENANVPSPSDFTLTCSTAVTQTTPYVLLNGSDGDIDLYLWTKDAAGRVSDTPSTFSINLDTTAPQINLTGMLSAYLADNNRTFSWTLTELNSSNAQNFSVELFNGTSWLPQANVPLTNGPHNSASFNTTIAIPNINVSNAKLRVSYTDLLGHPTTVESALFAIEKPLLAISPAVHNFGNVLSQSTGGSQTLTITNSGNVPAINCSAPTLSGANSSEFIIQTDNCSTNILSGSGATCTIIIAPKPNTRGAKTATLTRVCGSDSVTSNLSFTSTNNLPVSGTAQNITTNEDTLINFTANLATDIDGDALTYAVVTAPSNGSLTNCINSDNDLTCTYTPNADFNGSDSFVYKANDGSSDSSNTTTVSITVNAINDAPVMAGNQTETTNEDTPLNFTLNGATDIDIPAQTLSYQIVTLPTNGTITNCINNATYNTDVTCTYTPNANFNGSDSFTYKAYDSVTDSVTNSTVSITVNSINDAPVLAATHALSTNEDTVLNFNLNVSTDIDGDAQTYIVVTPPTTGALSCTGGASRACTYTPVLNDNGVYTFTYKSNDGSADSNIATATITVNPINDAPTIPATQSVATNEDTVLNFSLNAGTDVDADSLTYIITSSPALGTLSCIGGTNRSCTYTPVANDNGSYTFTYKVNDGTVDSALATVTISVSATNDAPTMIANQSETTNEDTAINFTLNGANDIDIPAQTLSYKIISAPLNGTISNCINTTAFVNDLTCTYTPNLNFNGTDSFTYRASDGVTGSSTDSTVTLNVTAVNDSPTLAATQTETTTEDTPITFNLNAGSDVENDTLSYIKITNPASGAIVCVGGTSRSCTYTPAANFNGSVNFTYKTNDSALDSNTATVTINITAVNDNPVMAADQSLSTNEDTALSFTLNGATDLETATPSLQYKIVSNTTNGTISNCINNSTFVADVTCTYTPNANFNGSDSFTYKAYDGALESTTNATITFTVNAINDAPTLAATQSVSTNEDTPLTFNLTAGSDIEGDTLTYIKVTNPASGSVVCTGGTSRSCTYTPSLNFNGSTTFTYKVNDSALDSTTATVTVTVNAVNDAPTLAATQTVNTNEDTPITFDLTVGADVDGDTLTYIKLTNPASGSLVCTGGTSRSCTYTPVLNYNGSVTFTYKVNDTALDSTTSTVTINVNAINDAPTLAATQAVSTNEDTALNFSLTAGADLDGDTLTYIIVSNPASGTLSCTGGTSRACTYTPVANFNGTRTFTYKVNDGNLDSTTNTVTITVNAVNDRPVMAANQTFATNDNTALNFTLSNATDIDGDALQYKVVATPANGTLSNCITTGTYGTDLTCTYTSNANFNGADSFTFIANDSTADALIVETVTINVSDKTEPSAPSIILASNVYRNATSNTLTATSCTDTPSIFINEGTKPSAGAAGWQSCTTTAAALSYTLASTTQGSHTLKAWSKDAYGNVSSASTDLNVVYDTVLPSLILTTPTDTKGSANKTLNWTLTETNSSNSLNFTVEYFNGSIWQSIGTTASANGSLTNQAFNTTWLAPALDISTAKFRVSFTDLAGNSKTTESSAFIIDSTAPNLTVTSPANNSYVQTSVTVSGACETGRNIDFSGDILANFSITCSGASFTQVLNLTTGDAAKNIVLSSTDVAGNTSTVNRTYNRDTNAPTIARTTGASPQSSKNNTVTWGGTCEGNYTVNVTGDATTSFNCSAGTWSWTTPAETVDATYNYTLIQTDAAGNSSTSLALSWTRDNTAPTFTVAQSNPTTNNQDSFTMSGNCEGSLPIAVTGAATANLTCVSGTWTWTTPTVSTDSARTYNFAHTDVAGNVSSISFVWTRDTTGPNLAITNSSNQITNTGSVTYSGSCETGLTINITGSATTSLACPGTTWTWTTPAETTDATRSYTFKQTNALSNTTTVVGSWIRETNAPTISALSTTASNPTTTNFVPVSMTATSQNAAVNITHFCLKSNTTTKPTDSDTCWMAVNSPSVALSPAQTLNLTNYSFLMGWEAISYNVTAWVKDAASNISDLTNAGVGTAAQDLFSTVYSPGAPPVIADVLAANIDTSTIPPSTSEAQVAAGSTVYVRWKVTDNVAFPAGAVSISYSEDEVTFTPATGGEALDAHTNHNCPSIALAANEGCFKWTNGSPLNNSYKIRVKVTDAESLSAQMTSNILNSDKIKIIAGNTESGLGGSAASAMFYTRNGSSESDPGTLAISDDGKMYIADYKRGILTVDPADGKQKVFIPQTGTSSGDGGAASAATLNYAVKITMDYANRLLILDRNRIRRVNLNSTPPTIETIIGGGADTGDTAAPLDVSIYNHSTNSWSARGTVFFAMPNGDIYFESDYMIKSRTDPTQRVRIFKAATGQVISKYLGGTGDGYDPTVDLSKCQNQHVGFKFNLATSQLEGMTSITKHHSSYTGCVRTDGLSGERYARTYYDPVTFQSIQGNDSYRYYRYFNRQGMDGNSYVIVDKNYINRINFDGTYTRVLGSGTRGECADGTAATSCNMSIQDMFMTSTGKIYFIDGGLIRTVDVNGNVLTIAGQRRNYGDGVNALNARFDNIYFIEQLNDGKVIVGDGYYFKEFSIEGNINVIAGDGNYRTSPDYNTAATSQGIYTSSWFTVNPATGEVYGRGYYERMNKLNRSTGKWERIVGCGSVDYWNADGDIGTNVRCNGNQSQLLPLGFANNKILTARMKYNSPEVHYEDFMLKTYDITTNYTQAHLAGSNDPAKTYSGGNEGICASGSLAATCKIPYFSYMGQPTWDATGNRWIFVRNIYGSSTSRQIYSLVPGGNITSIATVTKNIDNSYVYVRNGANESLYYCYGGRIQQHNMVTNAFVGQLDWPTPTLSCRGEKLLYNAARNSLIFPFSQNGLNGVAEYYLP